MDSAPISRRAFLAGSAGTGVALATATSAITALTALTAGPAGAAWLAKKAISPLVLSTDLYASPDPQRFVFAIARGTRYASFGDARVAFAAPGTTGGTVLDTDLLKDGLPKGRGIYVTEAVFPTAGVWKAAAVLGTQRVPFAVQVNPTAVSPVVGAPAPTAASPTPTATLGVDPICTRRPRCPLHDVSLTDLVGNGKPVVVLFATPALCQSQYCGPVLDQLLDVVGPYQQRGVQPVHVEIYASTRGATLSPTVEAWGIETEPWLYTIDGAGVIKERLDGAMATNEVRAALDRLVA